MRISVNVPDRVIVVDGHPVTFAVETAPEGVRTAYYDTDVFEGAVTGTDGRSDIIRDPAGIAPWVAIWTLELGKRLDGIAKALAVASDGFAAYEADRLKREAQDAADLEERSKLAAQQHSNAIESEVLRVIEEMAKG